MEKSRQGIKVQATRAMRRRQGGTKIRQRSKPEDQTSRLENRKVKGLETGTGAEGLEQGLDRYR